MKVQLEVLTIGRTVVCRECVKPMRSKRGVLYHPHADIYIIHGLDDPKHFNFLARQAVMLKLQQMGLGVKNLSSKKRKYTPKNRIPTAPKQLSLF